MARGRRRIDPLVKADIDAVKAKMDDIKRLQDQASATQALIDRAMAPRREAAAEVNRLRGALDAALVRLEDMPTPDINEWLSKLASQKARIEELEAEVAQLIARGSGIPVDSAPPADVV